MSQRKSRSLFALVTCCALTACVFADDAATRPTGGVINVGDKAALEAAMDKDVVIEGTCSDAAWSSSGKVMNISFAATEETHLAAVVFSRNKSAIDEAFGGDAAKAFSGAKLRIKGKLRVYGGKAGGRAGHPEITIADPAQVTIVEPAPKTQPATQPAP